MTITPLAERAHRKFRGSGEYIKKLRLLVLGLDILAAILACVGIFGSWSSDYLPLIILTIAVLGSLLRNYAANVRSFSQRARRISLRSLCSGIDLDHHTESNIALEAPIFCEWLAARLPAQSMEEYYEPVSKAGNKRLRELYAHSAFYTWRLLQISSWIAGIWSSVIVFLSFAIVYNLATSTASSDFKQNVLEALCTISFVVLGLRAMEAAGSAKSSFQEIREIENSLLRGKSIRELGELVDSYDIERAAGPDVPTVVYLLMRDSLQTQWHKRRQAIV